MVVLREKDEHFNLFEKPTTHVPKKYVHVERPIDYVLEYFKFEELKKNGFSNRFLTKNPYEGEFADYVEALEKKYSHLPEIESHVRVYGEIEQKYRLALGK
jgi:hypothetical protein